MDIDQDKLDRTLRESSEANKRSDSDLHTVAAQLEKQLGQLKRHIEGRVILDRIPIDEQENVISCYWQMMRELEEHARNTKSRLDEIAVEGYYRLWNRMTNDNKQPAWMEKK